MEAEKQQQQQEAPDYYQNQPPPPVQAEPANGTSGYQPAQPHGAPGYQPHGAPEYQPHGAPGYQPHGAPGYQQGPPGYHPQGYGQPPVHSYNSHNSNTIVVTQPAVVVSRAYPNDCLTCSILNLIFCNFLFGIIAVAMSCAARDAFASGDEAQGRKYATVAKIFNILSPILTVVLIIMIIVLWVSFWAPWLI